MFYAQLIASILAPVVTALILYFFVKKTKIGKLNKIALQIIAGVIFGLVACAATQFGIKYDGYVLNIRTAVPLTAGLLFGGPAGIISGVIGGIYRWVSVAWGIGAYTKVACSIGTVVAGLVGAFCRKFMFDKRKPSWFYSFFISIATEVFHMLLVFLTHMDETETAFNIVKSVAAPMILGNAISVLISTLIVTFIGRDSSKRVKLEKTKEKRPISQTFSIYLFVAIFVAYFVTSMFTYTLQDNISKADVESLLSKNITDVQADIMDTSDRNLLSVSGFVAEEINSNSEFTSVNSNTTDGERDLIRRKLKTLATKYHISEISIIDNEGYITISTVPEYDGYYMLSNPYGQASEFMCLLKGEKEYVQNFQPTDNNPDISMKYAGTALEGVGFVQVGYNAISFQSSILEYVESMASNRHIGKSGFVFIVNGDNLELISSPKNSISKDDVLNYVDYAQESEENTVFTYTSLTGDNYFTMYTYSESFVVGGSISEYEVTLSRDMTVYIGIFMQVIIFSSLFVLIFFLIKKIIVNNINKINDSLDKITKGDLDTVVDVYANKEFTSLSNDINTTVSRLKDYIAEAEARIDKELEFAKSIQHSALPSVFPAYPNRKEFDIHAMMATAKEVGGDFYDFYLIDQNKLAFLIADVSGKGIPAAMFMMTSKTMIKNFAESGLDVNDVFTKANEKLCENNEADMFVTAWLGILDLNTGLVKFANAGHNPPLVKHKDGKYEFLKSRAGFVLAGMDGVIYRENELQLEPGDEIYLYTDGVTEATDKDNQLFGDDRLMNVLNIKDYSSCEEICNSVKASVDEFVGEAPQFDDITMVSLKYFGKVDKEEVQ